MLSVSKARRIVCSFDDGVPTSLLGREKFLQIFSIKISEPVQIMCHVEVLLCLLGIHIFLH